MKLRLSMPCTSFVAAAAASAALVASPCLADEPEASSWIQFGDCQLTYDPLHETGRESLAFKLCLRGRGGAEINFVSGTPEENAWMKHGDIQGGMFITRWLSLQARGYVRDIEPLDEAEGPLDQGSEPFFDRSRRYAVLQIGNPALHRIRLTGGLANLPFGIDRSDTVESYRMHENRGFWSSPQQAAWLTIDNQVNYQLDLGVATDVIDHANFADVDEDDEIVDPAAPPAEETDGRRAFAARLMVDFSALDGSRLIVSGSGEGDGRRRFGFGFVTAGRDEDLTQFEFVRSLKAPDGGGMPFEQLLRLAYVGAWKNGTRVLVQIDDERYSARSGTLGFDALFYDHFAVRFSVSHIKSEVDEDLRRWFLTSGLEVML